MPTGRGWGGDGGSQSPWGNAENCNMSGADK